MLHLLHSIFKDSSKVFSISLYLYISQTSYHSSFKVFSHSKTPYLSRFKVCSLASYLSRFKVCSLSLTSYLSRFDHSLHLPIFPSPCLTSSLSRFKVLMTRRCNPILIFVHHGVVCVYIYQIYAGCLGWMGMLRVHKECNSSPFSIPQKKDGIPPHPVQKLGRNGWFPSFFGWCTQVWL